MVGRLSDSCARAASGQAVARLPISAMNSRRLNRSNCISCSPVGDSEAAYPINEDQVRGLLRCGISILLMSDSGSKARITAPQHGCPLRPQLADPDRTGSMRRYVPNSRPEQVQQT